MLFTVEEMNLMCIYDTGSRAVLLSGVREGMTDVYDPDMREIMERVITKLERLTDGEFDLIGFTADYDEDGEGD